MALNINTGAIRDAATSVASIKSELEQLLTNCNETVQGLKNTWEGKAADATTSAFNAFYQKYNTEYNEVLTAYINFLNTNAAEGYDDTENKVERLSDSI
jgi:Uncharacterized protein conserved in bacteria